MEWNYEESLKGIAKASVENWKALKDGVCVVCGSKDAGYYDLCPNCQDKPIPDYEAFHVAQLFNVLHKAVLSDMMVQLTTLGMDRKLQQLIKNTALVTEHLEGYIITTRRLKPIVLRTQRQEVYVICLKFMGKQRITEDNAIN